MRSISEKSYMSNEGIYIWMQVKYRMRKKFSSVSYENDFKDSLFIYLKRHIERFLVLCVT